MVEDEGIDWNEMRILCEHFVQNNVKQSNRNILGYGQKSKLLQNKCLVILLVSIYLLV